MRSPALLALVLLAAPALAGPAAGGLICAGSVCNHEATTTNGPANEVFVAVDPTDSQHIVAVAKDYTLGASNACGVTRVWVGYYTSFDGGQTWTNGLLPGYLGDPRGGPLKGYGCVSDPTVAIGGDGTVYVGGLPISGPGGKRGVITFQSNDGGLTFPIHGWSIEDSTSNVDKNWLEVDPVTHQVYTSWTNFGGETGIHFGAAPGGPVSRASGALRFGAPVCLSCGGFSGQGSFIAVGLDSTVYVSWISSGRIVLAKSDTLGKSFTSATVQFTITGPRVGHVFRTPTLPQLAIDRSSPDGRLYVTWQDGRDGNSDAYVASSADRGATWGPHVRVNGGVTAKQFFPTVCVGPDGTVRTSWIDSRNDPANHLMDTYGATSLDGGATWAEQRLTTVSSDPSLSRHQSGFIFFGDYIGVACARDGTAYTVWVDTRNGAADAFVAHWT